MQNFPILVLLIAILLTTISPFQVLSQPSSISSTLESNHESVTESPSYPTWQKVFKGLAYTKLSIKPSNSFIKSDLYLLKLNLEAIDITAVHAPTTLGSKRSSIDKFVHAKQGIAGINANFFDTSEAPLGILISQTERLSSLHEGGKLLTGVFQIKNNIPSIIHRNDFQPEMVNLAVQAGPVLISKGKPKNIISQENKSRRSGIAITKNGELVLFATELRFPGATLSEIQHTLVSSGLDISEALNLDGGGSSQLFFYTNRNKTKEIFISGGDTIPAALVVTKKQNNNNES